MTARDVVTDPDRCRVIAFSGVDEVAVERDDCGRWVGIATTFGRTTVTLPEDVWVQVISEQARLMSGKELAELGRRVAALAAARSALGGE